MVENDTENGVAGTEMTIAGENGNKETFPNGQAEVNGIAGDGEYDGDDHDAASEEKQKKKRELPPLAYCRFIAGNPRLAFGLALGGHIVMLMTTGILVAAGYDLIPITFDRLPLDIRDNVDYLRFVAWQEKFEQWTVIGRGASSSGQQMIRTEKGDILELFYEIEEGNVFTQANLMEMKNIEDQYWEDEEFLSSFCMREKNPPYNCTKPVSVLRFFDGTYADEDPIFVNPNFENISRTLNAAKLNNATRAELYYTLGKNSTINATHAVASIIREKIFLGVPLIGYNNETDRDDDQLDDIQKFTTKNFKTIGKKYFSSGAGEMSFFYSSYTLLFDAIQALVYRDISLVFGSILFIILFLLFQTGSVWVTGWGVFSIISGFLIANLIYRIVLDFQYFGIFHVLAIFILLCIGADDIFVFFDTWKFSAHHKYPSIAHRLSDCYRKAAGAMLYTSLTTAVAFAVSASSPMLAISTFGLFSALLILVNYMSIIIFFPTVVVSYHVYWEKYKCCCCCPRGESSVADVNDTTPASEVKTNNGKRHNLIVRFFGGPYFRFITHPVARWVILAFFAALVSTSIYFVSTLKINEEQVKFLKENTNFGKYLAKSGTDFPPRDESGTTYILLLWGFKEQDLSSCHRTDHKCMGETVWDNSFDINTPEAQQSLQDLCTKLKKMSKEEKDRLHIRDDLVTGESEVECFIDEMNTFYQSEQVRRVNGTDVYPNGTELTLPASQISPLVMEYNSDIYNRSALPGDFNRYFEVAASFWLYNAFQAPFPSSQLTDYTDFLGESKIPSETVTIPLPVIDEHTNVSGWSYQYGTRLRYVAISISTTMEQSTLGYKVGLPVRDAWEDLMDEEKKHMPAGLQGGFQLAYQIRGDDSIWHWIMLQKTLVNAAIKGMGIGLGVALPILIFATANVYTGLLATLSLILSTLAVVAIIPLGGWKLGLMESINLTLVVGLSVDYVVHLAEGYSRSTHNKRRGRLHDTLVQLGISVLSGACTTMGGSAFLLLAEIILFMQFGLFMFATILFSVVFALGFFTTMLGIIGPEYERGSIKPFKNWLVKVVTCKICRK